MKRPLIVGAALLLTAGAALADAPFCVVSGAGRQCFYYDVGSCWQAARQAGGMCVGQVQQQPQYNAMPAPRGSPFCVVYGGGSMCNYYDLNSCQSAAQTMGGMCVANPDG